MPSVYTAPFDGPAASTLSGDQDSPDIAVLNDGSYVVVWQSYNVDTAGLAIVSQRFNAEGQNFGFNAIVNSTWAGNQGNPSIAALSDGGYVITWESENQDGDGYGVYGQRFSALGEPVGSEFRANTTTASWQQKSDVDALSNGGFVVVWQSLNQDGADYGIYGQRYDAAGAPQGVEFRVNSFTASAQVHASVTSLVGGGFVVTWHSVNQDGSGEGVYAQRYDAAGDAAGPEFLVNTTTVGNQSFSQVDSLADGGFIVTWATSAMSGSGIFGQRFDATGTRVGGEFRATDELVSVSSPVVAGTADGGWVISWTGLDEDQLGVFAQRFDSSGQRVGEVQLNDVTASWQTNSAIAAFADGGFAAAWMSYMQDGDGYGVYRNGFHGTEDGFATELPDKVIGTTENDYLAGLGAEDEIYGLAGDDVLDGGASVDKLYGGDGWDEATYEHAAAAVTVNLLTGGHGGEAFQDSFNSIEQFRLSSYNDRFVGASGDDAALGLAGDDQLTGGKGEDYLDGGSGNDVLQGGKGADLLLGGSGWDEASYAQDTLRVTIDLTTGINTGAALGDVYQSIEQFTLTQLNDIFVGGAADDSVYGASGNDQLSGGGGANSLDGGSGDDILNAAGGVDQLVGGQGMDEVRYTAASAAVTLNLASGVHAGQAAGDSLISIERYRLSTFNDTFTGSGAAELVYGDIGNDAINGGGGNDDLRGEAGNDSIDGGTGADAMAGGIGNDSYVVDAAGDVVTELTGEGTDLVQSSVTFSLAGRYIENLTLTGASAINGTGNSLDNVITGNGAANSLSGADGNDSLNGGGGIDSMSGGIGNDTYIVDNSADVVSEANGAGTDTVQSSASFSLAGQYADNLILTGASAINGSGNSLANTITGNSAANTLNGADGADSLYGKGGNDTLNGGTGTDSFFFDTALGAGNVDTIQSFSVADDTIKLNRTIFSGIGADGTLASGAFLTGAAAADAADRIVYDSATGKIFYDADGSGAGAAVLFAQVAAGTALTNLDFVAYSG